MAGPGPPGSSGYAIELGNTRSVLLFTVWFCIYCSLETVTKSKKNAYRFLLYDLLSAHYLPKIMHKIQCAITQLTQLILLQLIL